MVRVEFRAQAGGSTPRSANDEAGVSETAYFFVSSLANGESRTMAVWGGMRIAFRPGVGSLAGEYRAWDFAISYKQRPSA